ncbi:hypothetical protein GCM10027360_51820 [Amycolatopsis echigonensis]
MTTTTLTSTTATSTPLTKPITKPSKSPLSSKPQNQDSAHLGITIRRAAAPWRARGTATAVVDLESPLVDLVRAF